MEAKPKLSFWEIWNMSFGFLGIQFGFALQNANVSRIFETLGANKEALPILWLAAPVTGLLVQPIVGYYSDRTWNKLGRRRPFFLAGAILASIALVFMPNSGVLWVAAGMLWLMDGSINISMEPFRAFVGDMLPDEQRTKGFAMQSFFIGTGAVIASMLPWIFTNWFGVSNTAPEGQIPDSVKWSFYIGALAFMGAVLWTIFKTKEYPPEDMEAFLKEKEENKGVFTGLKNSFLGIFQMPKTMVRLSLVQFFSWFALFAMWIYTTSGITSHIYDMNLSGGEIELLQEAFESNTMALESKKASQITADFEEYTGTIGETDLVSVNVNFAKFFIDEDKLLKFDITAQMEERLIEIRQAYNTGADWVGVLFAVYNGVAALVAFLLPVLAKATNRKITHLVCLIAGGIGLISVFFISDPNMLILSMVGVGIAWASILSMPYAMLAGALPANKMGYYMGVFNFFIVIPQIVAAGILGFLLSTFFGNESIYALILGGVTMILAGFLTLMVKDTDAK
ncbi:MAG: maltose/moltooligosaccharide transporter [Flammeovirgaceae bacterium]|jgi:maltose/moltooligosaccharide transporter